MWGSWAARWHVELALVASALGAVPAALGLRLGWASARTTTLATCAALGLLAVRGLAPWALVGALVAVAASRAVPAGPWPARAVDAIAVVAVVALVDASTAATALTAMAAVAVTATGRRVDGRLPPFVAPAAAGVAAGGLWLCLPDTEAPLALGAALLAPLLADVATTARAGEAADGPATDVASPWVAAALAPVWMAGDGLAVRPSAAPVTLVVAAALVGPGLAARRSVGRGPAAGALVVGAVATVVAARTVGLDDAPPPSTALAVALATVALAPWWVLARRRDRTATRP